MDFYYLDVDFLNDDEAFRENYCRMSEYRQKKMNHFRFRKDQNLSLGAGILISRGLEKYGLSEREMEIQPGSNGKPYFANAPGIFFNVSHSGSMAVAAFSEKEIGCDVERIAGHDISIAERFFTRNEYEFIISAGDEAELRSRFVRVWTLKESTIKAAGLGLSLPLNSFEIIPPQQISEKKLPQKISLEGRSWHLQEIGDIPGYCCAVCEEI